MKLIDTARKYLGVHEGKGNTFDDTTPFGRMLKAAGHKDGDAWCSLAVEAWLTEAYPEKLETIRQLCSSSAVATFRNFQKEGYKIEAKPFAGAIVIWQKYKDGKPQWQGHAGVVSEVLADGSFKSIEGNTNSAGSREGDSVQEKTRKVIRLADGLNVMGFIDHNFEPKEITT